MKKLRIANFIFFFILTIGCCLLVFINKPMFRLSLVLFDLVIMMISVGNGDAIKIKQYHFSLLMFIIWGALTCIWRRYKADDVDLFFSMTYIIITVVLLTYYIDGQDKIIALMKAIVVAEIIQGLYQINYYGIQKILGGRIGNDILNSNQAGIGYGTAALMCMLLYDHTNNILNVLMTLILIMLVFLSGSRTALISFGMSMIIYYWFKGGVASIKRIINIVLVAIMIGLGVFFITNIEFLYEIIGIRVINTAKMFISMSISRGDTSTYTRYQLYMYGLKRFLRSPIIGYGWDQYRHYVQVEGHLKGLYHGVKIYSHSNIVEIAFNLGLVGVFLFYYPVLALLIQLYKRRSYLNQIWRAYALAVCAKLLIESLFAVYYYQILPWLTICIAHLIVTYFEDNQGEEYEVA